MHFKYAWSNYTYYHEVALICQFSFSGYLEHFTHIFIWLCLELFTHFYKVSASQTSFSECLHLFLNSQLILIDVDYII